MVIDFTLPELGENIETGDVVQVLVKPGDTIETDQLVLEIETDKATIEVPSPARGTVGQVAVKNGETIAVGQLLLTIETADTTVSPAPDRSTTPSRTGSGATGPRPVRACTASFGGDTPTVG